MIELYKKELAREFRSIRLEMRRLKRRFDHLSLIIENNPYRGSPQDAMASTTHHNWKMRLYGLCTVTSDRHRELSKQALDIGLKIASIEPWEVGRS